MRRPLILIAALIVILAVIPVYSDASESPKMLFDMGNGSVVWSSMGEGTVGSATISSASSVGLEAVFSGDSLESVGTTRMHDVGTQTCRWFLYEWDGRWVPSALLPSDTCPDRCLAWGFYPSSDIVPSVTPDHPSAWTSFRGDAVSKGSSDSCGVREAASPVEWYTSYTTGGVDSSIVAAGGLLYHTTGGVFGTSGEKATPWVYCLDASGGTIVWKYKLSYGIGYEVTTPVIVGDMLIVVSTDGSVYCFDRFGNGSGEGVLLHSMKMESHYPTDENGDIVWRGRTFMTGATSPVYDSGALYFGHSDGRILCYSVDRTHFEQLWEYTPSSTVTAGVYEGERGCFYYHPPIITDVDFGGTVKRVLYIGSYEGYAYAINASTGERIWTERIIDLDEHNIPHKGTPGSVSSIVPIPDGRLLISCTDGGMSCMTGYTVCVDATTGRAGGSDNHWKLDVMCTQPTVSDDGFSCYVSGSVGGQDKLTMYDGSEIDVRPMVCKFGFDGRVRWVSHDQSGEIHDYSLVKAPLTLADGVLYMMDYSAGTLYPSGGCAHAIDEGTGEHLWSVRLTPYSSGSYSMSMPTVIGGKVYVANDYGAVYCISDTPGQGYDGGSEKERINDLNHWSWYLLIGITVAATILFVRKYR